jgi:hypothetical protein
MTQQSAKRSIINNSSRCNHRFANGMRCRLSVSTTDSSYCASHAKLPENQQEPAETAATLTSDLKEFRSAIPINDFLARLLLLRRKQDLSPSRRRPRLHHQSTSPHAPRHRPRTQSQGGSQRSGPDHL